MLNVGANKGFNLAEWMQRYSAADVSNKQWHQLMMCAALFFPPAGAGRP